MVSQESNGHTYQMYVDGQWVSGASTYPVLAPRDGRVIAEAVEGTVADAQAAVQAAKRAFPRWSGLAPRERSAALLAVAKVMAERTAGILPTFLEETGASAAALGGVFGGVVSRFTDFAYAATQTYDETIRPTQVGDNLMNAVVRRRPVEVVASIGSYNVPIAVITRVAAALAMGNTVVLKAPPQDPLSLTELVRCFHDAGFPPGVLNLVTGSGPVTGVELVASPDVNMVGFTGSVEVGFQVAANASRDFKRILLELGGKGAAMVFEDADLTTAVDGIATTWSIHAGQMCVAPTRALVHRSLFDEVVDRLAKAASQVTVNPRTPSQELTPLISAAQRDRVETLLCDGVRAGAEFAFAESRDAVLNKGFYRNPGLLLPRSADNPAVQKEFFGPVVVAMPFDDEDEGISLANGTRYGLYDYVFTSNASRAMRVADRLESGGVGWNTIHRSPGAAFGGTKLSGVGRDYGMYALHTFSEPQAVNWMS
jgi:acyl-CoA reductase-like NAD-dependent aldehyde dehydrogenase